MKKIAPIVAVVLVVVLAVVFVPKLAHTCDDCGKFFIGAGYEPNIVSDLLNDDEQIICKDCAEKQHALAIAFGQSLDEFKRDIF
ncbi:MAG: hypothetical protein J1F23_03965 [Oscillospiraceae bacterium]|nr:hypothetical protein [Oscillospiraceae bacterium]